MSQTTTVVIRYSNRSALVTVTERPPLANRDPGATAHHTAECAGCLAEKNPPYSTRDSLAVARTWANQHAAECHALPRT